MSNLQTSVDINKLKLANQLKGKIRDLFLPSEINDLANKHSLPHYVLINPLNNESIFLFDEKEVQNWATSLLSRKECKIEQELSIINFNYKDHLIDKTEVVPPVLNGIKELYKLPKYLISTPPGIYFLCDKNEIVYVGQSMNVAKRIEDHKADKIKEWTDVYFIPCHINNLMVFEAAFIRILRPKYNSVGINIKTEINHTDRVIYKELTGIEV